MSVGLGMVDLFYLFMNNFLLRSPADAVYQRNSNDTQKGLKRDKARSLQVKETGTHETFSIASIGSRKNL